MRDFLKRRTPYTLIPTPLPDDRTTELQEMYFPSSPVGDLVAVMDACLHRLHDVPRAKELFDGLRHERPSHPILETRLYNAFIGAYIAMATTKDKDDYVLWMEEAWEIFDTMESGNVPCPPDSATYALMLIALIRRVLSHTSYLGVQD
jgi:DNA-directed RNA polymerase